ncbi:MAG TPA: DUF1178 family protein [Rhizomicrobium sp.]
MIVYRLQCDEEHGFEAWFRDSLAFDEQAAGGKLFCPLCDSRKVTKAPMAPAIAGSAVAPARRSAPDDMRKMRQFMTGLRKYVEQNADYVGPQFPEEARKIHYGETEERQIYGEATANEVRELIDEGVEIAPLPPDLDEAN